MGRGIAQTLWHHHFQKYGRLNHPPSPLFGDRIQRKVRKFASNKTVKLNFPLPSFHLNYRKFFHLIVAYKAFHLKLGHLKALSIRLFPHIHFRSKMIRAHPQHRHYVIPTFCKDGRFNQLPLPLIWRQNLEKIRKFASNKIVK